MGLLVQLRHEERGIWSGPLTSSSPELARLWAAPPVRSGVSVSETTALTYSAFWACVNSISTDCASLPLNFYQEDLNGSKTLFKQSKLYRLLHDEPNPEMSSMSLRQALTSHVLTWGNAYAEIVRDGAGRPTAIWPVTPERVDVQRNKFGVLQYQISRTDGPTDTLPAADVLHIPGLGFDGVSGYSVVAKARESIGLGLATEQFGATFFGNGSTFGGVISLGAGEQVTPQAQDNFRQMINAQHQGVDRAHKFLLLGNAAKYDRLGIPPNDAQFLETRWYQIEEMCRWFRIPPHKLQHLLRSTNNNIEHQGIEYYTDTLRPWLVRWEQELNRKLVPASERNIQKFEHKIDGVLRGDLASRYAAYAVGRQWGWLSSNDIRRLENMNTIGDGDMYLVPLNMTPADRINELIDKQVAPPPTPVAPVAAGGPPADPAAADQAARAVEAIRAALTESQQRADAHLARAIEAEANALKWKDSAGDFEATATTERAAAETACGETMTLRALLIEATERADREQAARADAEAQTKAAGQLAELQTEAAETAQADIVTLRAQIQEDARGQESLAESLRRATEEAVASTDAVNVQRAAELQHLTVVIPAIRALVVDALRRVIRKETDRARKHQASPEKLRAWAGPFYSTHDDTVVDALLPAIRVHLAWQQSTEDADAVTRTLARAHIAESLSQLRALVDGVDTEDCGALLERMLTKWETQRPDQLADSILKDEVAYVRSR